VSAGGAPAVGLVGLGTMGGRIAVRLLDAGHELVAYDPDPAAAGAARGAGAKVVDGPRAVADAAPIVFASLPSPETVRAVALSDGGLAGGAAITTFVDLSTTGPAMARDVAAGLAEHGIVAVDAPVSGGPAGAEAGRLTVMLSGPATAVDAVRPLVDSFAGNAFVVGDGAAHGQAAKVLNNILSACSIAITAEALVVGVRAGLDPKTLLEVIAVSSGSNTAVTDKFPKQVLTREFDHGFRLDLMLKDVRLALDEGRSHGVPMVLGAAVGELWELGQATTGDDTADCTEIVRMFETWGGAEIA
jgi:3-hydroxyisobutyrate dehydrogenase-like beta-hydroxyacid dehydrogenase